MHGNGQEKESRPWGLALFLVLACAAFIALGLWQVQRMGWKHDLIARVDARIHADPAALPATSVIDSAPAGENDYLRIAVRGTYMPDASARVRAATQLGTGYWALTAMRLADGRTLWINRGFVPVGTELGAIRKGVPAGEVNVTGLLRSTEPDGSLLQSNKPEEDRWYSRDIAALSLSREVTGALPVFIDAQAETASGPSRSGTGAQPVPGLTVVNFPDNHLGYALTWFALAALSLVGVWLAWRRPSRSKG